MQFSISAIYNTICKIPGGTTMSNIHKNPTISFRLTPYERKEIEARIKASGLSKRIFYTRSCLYNRICVVGKKETILPLVDEIELLYHRLLDLGQSIITFGSQDIIPKDVSLFQDEINELQEDLSAMLKAVVTLLDGAKYLWQNEPTSKK